MSAYNLTVSPASVSVSLSRTGGQGTKGDSITSAYIDGSGDFHVVISNAANEVVSDTNLGGSTIIAQATAAAATATAALASTEQALDEFDDRWLGVKATAPTVDNDGDAIVNGAIYFDSTTSQLGVWNGSSFEYPVAEASTFATNAQTSATNAYNSAIAAATSETAAETAETNAAGSALDAFNYSQTAGTNVTESAQYAANSLASATNSANSAAAAAISADEASHSADQAALSASSAVTSADTATAQATLANTKAAAALNSAIAAATSETAAELAETNAAGSALDAFNYASTGSASATNSQASAEQSALSAAAAAASATTAGTKATQASTSATNAAASEVNTAADAVATAADRTAVASDLLSVQNIFDSFDDRYLGAKATDPTVDNDGNALLSGSLYWDTTNSTLKFYNGATWEAPSASAATSATNAATSETNAATSETNAATSAASALASQSAASTSETNAATSETNAAASEASATASASAASTSETNAAASEVAAANSETAAAASQASASTSATNAAASQAAASTSATNAATSETNAAASEAAASTAATSATSSYDQFDDRYLGSKASDPTVDNDGDAILTGAIYFDSTNNVVKVYNGTDWQNASSSIEGIKTDFLYTAILNQTLFVGNDDNTNTLVIDKAGLVSVFMNGIRLVQGTDYTVNVGANSITLAAGAAAGDTIEIQVFGNFTGQSGAEVAITGGSITGLSQLGVSGDIAVTGTVDGVDIAAFKSSFDTLNLDGDYVNLSGDTMTGNLDVQGTITSDGLTVDKDGESTLKLKSTGGSTTTGHVLGKIEFESSDTSRPAVKSTIKAVVADSFGRDSELYFTTSDSASDDLTRLKIGNTGDISFYEDTGTTAKFFWDAADERLGIGTSSPSELISVEGVVGVNADAPYLALSAGRPTDRYSAIGLNRGGTSNQVGLSFYTTNNLDTPTEKMRIDSSGNLLVGVASLTGASGPRDTSTTAGLGVGLNYYGGVYAAGYQASPFVSNRISNDGELFTFKKDGSPVGSIQSRAGVVSTIVLDPRSGGGGLTGGGAALYPTDNAGAPSNGDLTLGDASSRFKDLHLSGTVNIANWDIKDDGSGNLMFSVSGVNKMRLNADGSLDVAGDINANATL